VAEALAIAETLLGGGSVSGMSEDCASRSELCRCQVPGGIGDDLW